MVLYHEHVVLTGVGVHVTQGWRRNVRRRRRRQSCTFGEQEQTRERHIVSWVDEEEMKFQQKKRVNECHSLPLQFCFGRFFCES